MVDLNRDYELFALEWGLRISIFLSCFLPSFLPSFPLFLSSPRDSHEWPELGTIWAALAISQKKL